MNLRGAASAPAMERFSESLLVGGMALFVLLLPFHHLTGGIRIVYRWALIAAVVAWFARGMSHGFREGRRRLVPLSPIVAGAAAYALACSISALASDAPLASLPAVSRFLLRSMLALLVVATAFGTGERAFLMVTAIASSGVALAGVAWVLFVAGYGSPFGGLSGPTMDYNSLSMWLIATVPFVWCGASAAASRAGRAVWCTAAAFVTTSVLLTFSRIGWVAFGCAVVLWVILVPEGRRRLAGALAAGALLALALGPPARMTVTVTDNDRFLRAPERLDASVMKTMSWRDVVTLNHRDRYAWLPALEIVARHPVLGAGYGPSTFEREAQADGPLLTHEHNLLLAVAVQSGFLGLAAFVAFLLALLARAGAGLRHEDARVRLRLTAVLVAVVAEYLVQGLGEPNANAGLGILLFTMAGLAAGTPLGTEDRAAAAAA